MRGSPTPRGRWDRAQTNPVELCYTLSIPRFPSRRQQITSLHASNEPVIASPERKCLRSNPTLDDALRGSPERAIHDRGFEIREERIERHPNSLGDSPGPKHSNLEFLLAPISNPSYQRASEISGAWVVAIDA